MYYSVIKCVYNMLSIFGRRASTCFTQITEEAYDVSTGLSSNFPLDVRCCSCCISCLCCCLYPMGAICLWGTTLGRRDDKFWSSVWKKRGCMNYFALHRSCRPIANHDVTLVALDAACVICCFSCCLCCIVVTSIVILWTLLLLQLLSIIAMPY